MQDGINMPKATLSRGASQTITLGLVFAFVSLQLMSCAPTYDATADQMLADPQKQADDGLFKLENLGREIQNLKGLENPSPEDQKTLAADEEHASYSSNIGFYSSLQASALVLDQRITSNPDFSVTRIQTSLQDLEKNVDKVREQHAKAKTISPAYARGARELLDQQFKALTVYELQIKNGSKPQQ
jgi:hypothetical protein